MRRRWNRQVSALAPSLLAAAFASWAIGARPATAQEAGLTDPEVMVGLFFEGCLWTAPDFRDASLVFEREGLAQSTVVFDRELYVGPSNVVSASIEDRETERRCRLVARNVDEAMVGAALTERLEAEFGVLLKREASPDGRLVFSAPIAGVEAKIVVEPAEEHETPRAMLIATMPKTAP